MPIVPIPEGPSVAPDIPRAPSFPSIPQGGDAVAQGLSNIGAAFQQIAHEEQEKEDRVVLTTAQNELEGWDQNEKWNPDTGLFFKDGQAYLSEASKYPERFSKQRGAILDRLTTERQRAAFGQWSDSHAVRARGEVDIATGKKRREFDAQQTQTRDRLIQLRSQTHYTDDAALEIDREALRGNLASFAQSNDWSPEQIELALKAKDAELYQGAIQRALADGFGGRAKELLDKHSAELEPEVVEQLESRIREENRRDYQASLNRVQEALGEEFGRADLFPPSYFNGQFEAAVQDIVTHPGFSDTALTENDVRYSLAAPLVIEAIAEQNRHKFDTAAQWLPNTNIARTFRAESEGRFSSIMSQRDRLEEGVTKLERALAGQEVEGDLPRDEETINELLKRREQAGVPMSWSVSQLVDRGLPITSRVEEEIRETLDFNKTTYDPGRGVAILEALPNVDASRIAFSAGPVQYAIWNITRDMGLVERDQVYRDAKNVGFLKHAPEVQSHIDGVEATSTQKGIAGVDAAKVLGYMPNPDTHERFKGYVLYNALRLMSQGEPKIENAIASATAEAVRKINENVGTISPVTGKFERSFLFFGSPKAYRVDRRFYGSDENIRALQEKLNLPISPEFGLQTIEEGTEGLSARSVVGEYRPDFPITVPGIDGVFIPNIRDTQAIGFVQWNPATGEAVPVGPKSNPGRFGLLKDIFDRGTDKRMLRIDSNLVWTPTRFPNIKRVSDVTMKETRKGLYDGFNLAALETWKKFHDDRGPDMSNPAVKKDFMDMADRIARDVGAWEGGLGISLERSPE